MSAVLFAGVVGSAFAQSWIQAYNLGLSQASSEKWTEARAAFQQAIAFRPEDTNKPTILPGSTKARIEWRSGALYSPNFLSAYAGYRAVIETPSAAQTDASFQTVGAEFQTLIAKGQSSAETRFFLADIYRRLGVDPSRKAILNQGYKSDWKVDTEPVSDTEKTAIANLQRATPPALAPKKIEDLLLATKLARLAQPIPVSAAVPIVHTKFALLIGNSAGRLGDQNVPFSGDDVQSLREALVQNTGYAPENIEVVLNATSAQLAITARALSDRVSDGGTVLIYFSGAGANVEGHDYLAGVDTSSGTETSTMLAKLDLYRPFMAKGARIFAFYQVNRPTVAGRFFGSEIPSFGSIAQIQATLPGEQVASAVKGGKQIGLFTQAMISVLTELRSSQIPIQEFGWQVFYRIRRGDTGTTGGASRQTPTLPMLSNLAADARF